MTLVCLGKEANKGKAGGMRRRPESGIVVLGGGDEGMLGGTLRADSVGL